MKNIRRKQTSLQDANLYDQVTHLETAIIEKILGIRKNQKRSMCQHLFEIRQEISPFNPGQDYYQKFWKLYMITELMKEKTKRLQSQIQNLEDQIWKIQNYFEKLEQIRTENKLHKTKTRRKADHIQKKYQCQYEGCFKNYGTQPALRLHLKQKHFNIDQYFNMDS